MVATDNSEAFALAADAPAPLNEEGMSGSEQEARESARGAGDEPGEAPANRASTLGFSRTAWAAAA